MVLVPRGVTLLTNQQLSARNAKADEFSRQAYWEDSHDFSSNQLSPAKKEVLRSQILGSVKRSAEGAVDSCPVYQTKRIEQEWSHGPKMLDTTKFLSDKKVQAIMAPVGSQQRMPGNIPDHGPHNNVNKLRFQREQKYADPLLMDAGTVYQPAACIGNWVEERRDKDYKSGFHARELGIYSSYMSEHSDRYRPPTPQYQAKMLEMHRTYDIPNPDQAREKVQSNKSDGSHVYYAKGFGESYHLDHTSPDRRGGFWVGTAPVKDGESMATTASKGETLEFQNRVCFHDPKSKVITGSHSKDVEAAMAATERDRMKQSELNTLARRSMYTTEISQQSATCNHFRPVSVSSEWAAAKAAVLSIRPMSSRPLAPTAAPATIKSMRPASSRN